MEKKTILIIDGNGLARKCMYVYRDLKVRQGDVLHYTGTIYGFFTNTLALYTKFKPDQVVIAWDGGSEYRKNLYSGYKKKRKIHQQKEQADRDFLSELIELQGILKNTGLKMFRTKGEEGDDIIGTFCKKYRKKYKIIIASNDYDMLQLLKYNGVRILMSNLRDINIYTRKKFITEYGFHPKFYPNVLAIGGDRTDEYPGIRGISEKSAISLVAEYGPDIDSIFKNTPKDNRQGKLLCKTESRELVNLFLKLAIIRCGVVLSNEGGVFNRKLLESKFKEYKFHSLLFNDRFLSLVEMCKKSGLI